MLFLNTRWKQLLIPLEILMSKTKYIQSIYEYEVYSHSYSQFWALQGDYEYEIIQPWFPVSHKYK